MKVSAKGQLRHRFFGQYSAVIGLKFDCPGDAIAALPKLGAGWSRHETVDHALIWVGDSDALKACETTLERFGAEKRKIASLAKSVDYGEPFSITVEVEDPNQLTIGGVL